MIGRPEENESIRRISDLRRAQHGDPTLHNLVGVLTTKLDLCSRLPVYEWEARQEGNALCANAFHELADAERRTCGDILNCLRDHLERRGTHTEGGRS